MDQKAMKIAYNTLLIMKYYIAEFYVYGDLVFRVPNDKTLQEY
jgi:hypothetical protein